MRCVNASSRDRASRASRTKGRHAGQLRRGLVMAALAAGCAAAALAEDAVPASEPGAPTGAPALSALPGLSAEQIVERNVAARGGLEAWRRIQTMAWTGHMESANTSLPMMRFVLEQKRPNKTRFEVDALSRKTLRVFDGSHGWKVHPDRDGRPDVESYSAQELRFARTAQAIDGPLIDCQAHGNQVVLAGMEKVEGHRAYRLEVRLPGGEQDMVWIDAQTFLELRYDRTSYSTTGTAGRVPVYYRNYKDFGGVQIPAILEIGLGSGKPTDRMVIEKVALNPPLEDRRFNRPLTPRRRDAGIIELDPPLTARALSAEPPDAPLARGLQAGRARE